MKAAPKNTEEPNLPWIAKIAFGGFAGMVATSIVHPLDMVKVRMQIFPCPCTTMDITSQIIRCRGFRALYAGLTAGLMRQATNTTTRLGVYHWLSDTYYRDYDVKPTLQEKVLMGIIAGLAGSIAGNPSEVALVRMMADGPIQICIPCHCPPKYRGVMHCICRVYKEEGVGGLWRGGTLSLSRSVFVSCLYIGTYAKMEDLIRERRIAKGLASHVYTSLITSFFTAVLTLPIDLVKTRFQVRLTNITQKEIFYDILRQKGIFYFWKGFLPYYIRMTIHTITTFLILKELNERQKGSAEQIKGFIPGTTLVACRARFQVRLTNITQKEIFYDILRQKGIFYFWKGFLPYYIRMTIHTITTFLILKELNERYRLGS